MYFSYKNFQMLTVSLSQIKGSLIHARGNEPTFVG